MAAKKATAKKTTAKKMPAKRGGAGKARAKGDPSDRILASVLELAEQGGFEAVQIRDVAAHAEVALGTLYRRFRSKEDLLVGVLELESRQLFERIKQRPFKGDTPLERVSDFFSIATRGMLRKPNLTRATLRAVASGNPELVTKVAAFHLQVANLITKALRGGSGDAVDDLTEEELKIAFLLQQIWFAQLVGWAGGLQSPTSVREQMHFSVELLLKGAESLTSP